LLVREIFIAIPPCVMNCTRFTSPQGDHLRVMPLCNALMRALRLSLAV